MSATPATCAGLGGLPLVTLRAADGSAADVYLHGAHVTSWCPAPDLDDRLFLSARSEFRAGSERMLAYSVRAMRPTSDTAASLPTTARAQPPAPRDRFDPEIFNRRYHGQ